MKRISFVLALAFVFALGNVAFGAETFDPRGVPLPKNAMETTTFELTESGDWIVSSNAKSYNSLGVAGHCNRECWEVALENHVSVAQWIDWTLTGTRKDWRVLKPGTYASDSIKADIRSNNDVLIRFWAEDPVDMDPDGESPPIPKWFGYSIGRDSGDSVGNVVEWIRASEYTEESPLEFIIPFEAGLAEGLEYSIWEKIEVGSEHRASEYYGEGGLLICVTNLKYWVDPETGGFLDDEPTG